MYNVNNNNKNVKHSIKNYTDSQICELTDF